MDNIDLKKWALEYAKSFEYSVTGEVPIETAIESAKKIISFLENH